MSSGFWSVKAKMHSGPPGHKPSSEKAAVWELSRWDHGYWCLSPSSPCHAKITVIWFGRFEQVTFLFHGRRELIRKEIDPRKCNRKGVPLRFSTTISTWSYLGDYFMMGIWLKLLTQTQSSTCCQICAQIVASFASLGWLHMCFGFWC